MAQYGPAALLWRTVVPTLPPSPLTAPYVQHLSATFTVEEGANTPLLSHPLLENCATRGVFAVLGGASFPFVDARAPPYNRRNTPTPPPLAAGYARGFVFGAAFAGLGTMGSLEGVPGGYDPSKVTAVQAVRGHAALPPPPHC